MSRPCEHCEGHGRKRRLNLGKKAVDLFLTSGLSLFDLAVLDDDDDPDNWERCWQCRGTGELP